MNKLELKEEDEVALRDPRCSNNVFKGTVTCITKGKQGIWVAVNYRYGLLPSVCARNPDKWELIKTDGSTIVGRWDKYQKILDRLEKERAVQQQKLKALKSRTDAVVEALKAKGIDARVTLGMLSISVEDMEKLLNG